MQTQLASLAMLNATFSVIFKHYAYSNFKFLLPTEFST